MLSFRGGGGDACFPLLESMLCAFSLLLQFLFFPAENLFFRLLSQKGEVFPPIPHLPVPSLLNGLPCLWLLLRLFDFESGESHYKKATYDSFVSFFPGMHIDQTLQTDKTN